MRAKEKKMKKLFMTLTAAAIIVASAFFTLNSSGFAVTAFPESGEGDKAVDLTDAYSALNFIIEGYYEGKLPDELEAAGVKPITSITYTEDLTGSTKTNYFSDSISKSSITSDSIGITAYISEYTTYYIYRNHSAGYSDVLGEDTDNKYFTDIDIEVYFDSEKAMVKCNKYTVISNDTASYIKSEYAGRWIMLPDDQIEAAAELIKKSKTADNIAPFLLNDIMYPEEKEFKQNDKLYTYEDDDDDCTVNITVDLSKPESPYFEVTANQEDEDNDGYAHTIASIRIDDINNTEIKVNFDNNNILFDVDLDDIITEKSSDN